MAEPTKKAEGIEAFLTMLAGHDRRTAIREDKCMPPPIGCGGDAKQFDDELSAREYRITGMCQACQDRVFGDPMDDVEPTGEFPEGSGG